MADVLVDTSVWIDFFRNDTSRPGDSLDSLLEEDRALLCGIVEMEIFQGLRSSERREVEAAFELIPYVETTREDCIAAGTLWPSLRKEGDTGPPTDCLIAQLCLRHDFYLFSLDAHFDRIKQLKRLK